MPDWVTRSQPYRALQDFLERDSSAKLGFKNPLYFVIRGHRPGRQMRSLAQIRVVGQLVPGISGQSLCGRISDAEIARHRPDIARRYRVGQD